MTPDYIFPSSGALLGAKLGIPGVPALDLRQQCAAAPYSFQVANGLTMSNARATCWWSAPRRTRAYALARWPLLEGDDGTFRAAEEAYQQATEHRGMSILFGDGGRVVMAKSEVEGSGLIGAKSHGGRQHDALRVDAGGLRRRPFCREMIANNEHVPRIRGASCSRARCRLPGGARLCDQHK